ncbi:ceramide glucosyltransferase 3-like isoform X2 [Babylonia areolata]
MEDMVVKLQAPDVAVVHQLPFCLPGPSQHPMAHIVQQVYYGCGLGRHYVSFNTLGMACVAGLSYMVRRSMLERHCLDMQRYGQHVPHDFRLTKHLHQMGYKLVMSSFPAQQNVSLTSLGSFVDRMVRWSRLRYNALPVVGILEPLSECLPLGGLTSFFLFLFFGVRPLPFLCCHLTAWIVVDFLLLTQVQNGSSGISKFRFVCGWCLCQLVAVWIYVKAVCGLHRIRWGAHTYHVYTGGLVGKAYAI